MSIFTLLMTLLKELMPFLKESLLEGQTFRVWFKSNWLTFAWLANTLMLTLIIAYQSDVITLSRKNEHIAQKNLRDVKAPIENLIVLYKKTKNDNDRLSQELQSKEVTLTQYRTWLDSCGVNTTTGQCPISQYPTAKPTRSVKPSSRSKPAKTVPVEQDKPSFFRKLRRLFTRDKRDEK